MGVCALVCCVFGSIYQTVWKEILDTYFAHAEFFGLADSISSRICKPLFARVRPAWEESLHPRTPNGLPGSKYGFVSSHSANAFAVFSTAMMLLGLGRRPRLALMYLASCIAYSRVYLGVHYFGDVFFGALLGLAIAHGILRLYRNWILPKGWMA